MLNILKNFPKCIHFDSLATLKPCKQVLVKSVNTKLASWQLLPCFRGMLVAPPAAGQGQSDRKEETSVLVSMGHQGKIYKARRWTEAKLYRYTTQKHHQLTEIFNNVIIQVFLVCRDHEKKVPPSLNFLKERAFKATKCLPLDLKSKIVLICQ